MIDQFRGKYRFLSNFYPCVITMDGMDYPTIEHAYQASKTSLHSHRENIRSKATPGEAKKYGRIVPARSDWEEGKVNVMYNLLRQKFSNDPFKQLLIDTKDEQLIEGNTWHDKYWGKCYCQNCDGSGENVLGVLLMRVRKEIME